MTRTVVLGAATAILALAAACGDRTSPLTPLTPNPTFDVTGRVLDTDGTAIAGAQVAVIGGSGTIASAATDAQGRFKLLQVGVSGGVTIAVSHVGYLLWSGPLTTVSQIEIILVRLAPPVTNYTVTLTADASCGLLPPEVQRRTYKAVVTAPDERSGAMSIELSDTSLYPTQRIFRGYVTGASVRFAVWSWEAFIRWLDDLPIVEHVGETAYLAFSGEAFSAPIPAATPVTARFSGTLSYCSRGDGNALYFGCAAPPVDCRADNHQLSFTPER